MTHVVSFDEDKSLLLEQVTMLKLFLLFPTGLYGCHYLGLEAISEVTHATSMQGGWPDKSQLLPTGALDQRPGRGNLL